MKRKALFRDTTRGHGTVVLNSHGAREREFTYFARAFHRSAKELADGLKRTKQFGLYGIPTEDFRAYPVVFLYRHALELHMKAVILSGGPLLSLNGETPIRRDRRLDTHNLETLRKDVESVFAACGWPALETLRKVVAEFQAVDAGSYAFRYPVDKKGAAALDGHFTFNVFEFCAVLDEMLPTLLSAALGADDAVDARHDALAGSEPYEDDSGGEAE